MMPNSFFFIIFVFSSNKNNYKKMARVFVNHLIDLVCKEKEAAIDSERKLLLGHPLELAKKGIAILNVRELGNGLI